MNKQVNLLFLLIFYLNGCVSYVNKVDKSISKKYFTEKKDIKLYSNSRIRGLLKYNSSIKKGCLVKIDSNFSRSEIMNGGYLSKSYLYLSGLTLFILPYYYSESKQGIVKLVDISSGRILKEFSINKRAYYVNSLPLAILATLSFGMFDYSTDFRKTAFKLLSEYRDEVVRRSHYEANKIKECY